MDFLKTIGLAASGLKFQAGRMRVIAENIANSDSTGNTPGSDPYRRKIVTSKQRFDTELNARVVDLGVIKRDQSSFQIRLEPGHPAADAQGRVKVPNVSSLVETIDMREAQRSYEANLNMVTATRRMISRTLEILRA
jgi:flagellar basal-body rod protein FlgC